MRLLLQVGEDHVIHAYNIVLLLHDVLCYRRKGPGGTVGAKTGQIVFYQRKGLGGSGGCEDGANCILSEEGTGCNRWVRRWDKIYY